MKWIIEACPPQAKRAHKQEHPPSSTSQTSEVLCSDNQRWHRVPITQSAPITLPLARPSFVDTTYLLSYWLRLYVNLRLCVKCCWWGDWVCFESIDGCCMIIRVGVSVCECGGWGRVCEVCFESIEIDDNTWTGWVDGEGWPAVATEPPRQCAETGGWHRWQEPRGPEMDGTLYPHSRH